MAFRSFKKDVDKVYQQIDKIAKLGSENYQQYYDFIDDIVTRQQYGLFTEVLLIKYNFESKNYLSVSDLRSNSWKHILHKTTTSFQDAKYNLLNKNNTYQIGLTYYNNNTNLIIGTISEVYTYGASISKFGYTADQYQKLIENKTSYLSVVKLGVSQSVTFSSWNSSQSYDKNLLNLYQQAITYLI